MIDLHSHILPGLDDGARSLEESVAMVRLAAESGTTGLVASPHANLAYPFDPQIVERKLAEVSAAAGDRIELHYGCDFHLYYDNVQDALAHPAKYTIAHRRYLLVEFPDLLIPPATAEIFAQLLEAGMAPVVTHPERNFLLHTRLKQIGEWVEQGVLMQITAQSLLGRFGPEARRFSDTLIRSGLAHFVASDAHDLEDRPPRLDAAYEHVAQRYGKEWADTLLVINPRHAVDGSPLPPPPPPPVPKPWFAFWR